MNQDRRLLSEHITIVRLKFSAESEIKGIPLKPHEMSYVGLNGSNFDSFKECFAEVQILQRYLDGVRDGAREQAG